MTLKSTVGALVDCIQVTFCVRDDSTSEEMGDGQYQQGVRQTRSQGPVYLPVTLAGEVQQPEFVVGKKLGRLASRWIKDFLAGKLCDGESEKQQNLLRCLQDAQTGSYTNHEMILIPEQSTPAPNNDFERPQKWILSCHCKRCRRYFTLRGSHRDDMCCDGKTYRMHHIVQADHEIDKNLNWDSYWPILCRVRYHCSASVCRDVIEVEVTEPRISPMWMEKLVSPETTRIRLHKFLELDFDRFKELNSPDKIARLVPINYLQQYLTDVCYPQQKNPDGTKTVVPRLEQPLKVALRNKILQTCFGDEFSNFFRSIEFDLSDNGEYMLIPRLDPPTNIYPEDPKSRRAFFQDLKLEADILCDCLQIAQVPGREGSRLPIANSLEIQHRLNKFLNVPAAETSAKTDVSKYKSADFDLLGVNRNTHESLLWYACMAQGRVVPSKRGDFLQALQRVGGDRVYNSEELRKYLEQEQTEVATLLSLEDAPPGPNATEAAAYEYFHVKPSDISDYVLSTFRAFEESAQSPNVKIKHRQNLAVIGRARDNKELIDEAYALTVDEARTLLEVGADTTGDLLPSVAAVRLQDNVDKYMIAAALRVLSKDYPDNQQTILSAAAELDPEGHIASFQDVTDNMSAPAQAEVVDLTLPTGLDNIRNTCYLNSCLQYLNTVKAVWAIVQNEGNCRLGHTEEDLSARRLAGAESHSLTRGEAFVGRFFIDRLGELFVDLRNSQGRSIRPQQSLALAALNTADQLSKRRDPANPTKPFGPELRPPDEEHLPPPPLPARPSPMPPSVPPRDSNEPTVTVNAVSENLETASNVSSQTLVNQPDEEDPSYVNVSRTNGDEDTAVVIPASGQPNPAGPLLQESEDAEQSEVTHAAQENPNVDEDDKMEDAPSETEPKVEDTILKALNDTTVSGTDQQDVEEIMGNVFEHLRAGIKATGTDPHTGFQTDLITETFYGTTAKYLREVDESGKPKSPFRRFFDTSRWITAYPSKDGKLGIYEALDRNLDQEFQEGPRKLEQFTSIVEAPPVLHIYIQRGQNEAGRLGRNNNIVEIPRLLDLDRYMDSPEGSELFEKRKRSWNIKRRLRELSKPVTETKKASALATEINEPEYDLVDDFMNDDGDSAADSNPSSYSIINDKIAKSLHLEDISIGDSASGDEDTPMADSHGSLRARLNPDAARAISLKGDEEETALRKELDELFSNMSQQRYHLHAIICHGGGLSSGHYWTWIYDFEQNVWRSYNDSIVTVEANTEEVLKQLNSSSNPYYVAYVRECDAPGLVAVPRRTTAMDASSTNAQEDIEMVHVEHVEGGDPPPYTPAA